MSRHELIINTDHFQFHLEDAWAQADTSNLWTIAEMECRVASRSGFVAIGTERFGGTIQVVLEFSESEPILLPQSCDYSVRCSIQLDSGLLIVSAPETLLGDVQTISLMPGSYQLLVCFDNLDSVSDEMETTGMDIYTIKGWLDNAQPD